MTSAQDPCPVTIVVPDEWVLWRPGLNRASLRRRAIRECWHFEQLLEAGVGLLFVVLALLDSPTADWPMLAAGGVIIALVALWMRVDYLCWGHDLRPSWAAHRTDRGHGHLFWRLGDLIELPYRTVEAATLVIDVVRQVHGPVETWIEPRDLNALHVTAWDALSKLTDSDAAEPNLVALAETWTGLAAEARSLNWRIQHGRTRAGASVHLRVNHVPPCEPGSHGEYLAVTEDAVELGRKVAEQLAIARRILGEDPSLNAIVG